MPVLNSDRPYVFHFHADDRVEFEHAPTTALTAHLSTADPATWLWCLDCERSFQLSAARRGLDALRCAYPDCGGGPLEFWSWAAYRAFTGAEQQLPEPDRLYPLAA